MIAILIMCWVNLRGVRESGRTFALPTYLFSGSVILMIVVGLGREAFGDLPHVDPATLRHRTHAPATTQRCCRIRAVLTLLRRTPTADRR